MLKWRLMNKCLDELELVLGGSDRYFAVAKVVDC